MQITWPANHKYYDSKLYTHSKDISNGCEYIVAFVFAGNPNLMKMFDGKFKDAIARLKPPLDATIIQNLTETVLSMMDVLDTDPQGLHMMGAIGIPSRETRLLRTEQKVVSQVARYDYVGVGDSSVLRYLSPLLTQTPGYTTQQALNIGTYLVLQAKRYVDGCGGETNAIVISSDGKCRRYSEMYRVEQHLLKLEFLLNRAATSFFNTRDSGADFDDTLQRLAKVLKDERPESGRW